MASRRPQGTPRGVSGAVTTMLLACMVNLAPDAVASTTPKPKGDATGWADPYGYNVHAARSSPPPRPTPAHRRGNGEVAAGTPPAGPNPPTYCKEAAAGAHFADPLAVMSGTPVTCASTHGPTPHDVAAQAWKSLRLPLPLVRTAPPRGTTGLVGLPEWVWIPRDKWRPLVKRASAGAVWAQVTATPQRITITPGPDLTPVGCDGPGTAYDPGRSASAQRTACSYTYGRSSAGEPGGAYRVTVSVTWAGRWAGSDGAGGVLPDLSRSTTFWVRVAEAQGLYG